MSQYELIKPLTDPLGIYAKCQSNGAPIRFHQICMRIEGTWEAFLERVNAQDLPLVMWRDMGGGQSEIRLSRCAGNAGALS